MHMGKLATGLGLLLLAAGCGDSGAGTAGGTDYMDDVPPNGCGGEACPTTATGTTSPGSSTDADTTGGDQCQASTDCPDGSLCAAPFDGDNRGPFECVSACIEIMDNARWCADAAACCNAAAICTDRGYCREPGGGTSGTGTSTGTSG